MIRAFLGWNAFVFLGFGILMFFNPERAVDALGATTMSSDGIYEMRGIYGGVSFGAGLLALAGVLKTHMERPALYFLLAYTGGYALARIAALPLDGFPGGLYPMFAGFEILTALISIYLLRRRAGQQGSTDA